MSFIGDYDNRNGFFRNEQLIYSKPNEIYINDGTKENNLLDETHAIHGGGLPLITKNEGFVGILIISGLPQVEDHLLGVEVLTEFLARKGELL